MGTFPDTDFDECKQQSCLQRSGCVLRLAVVLVIFHRRKNSIYFPTIILVARITTPLLLDFTIALYST